MRILAISGSLRAASSNRALIEAAARLAPEDVEIEVYKGLGSLPHFNPDLDCEDAPAAVADWRAQLRAADGVMISSPEYAYGVPGTLKNALDWVAGSGELINKPTAVINASPRAFHAQASLLETLTTMSARLVSEACIVAPLTGKQLDALAIVAQPEISSAVRAALIAFTQTIRAEVPWHV